MGTRTPTPVTLVLWSRFARAGKTYMDRILKGESFVILHNGVPVAVVRPISPEDVTVTVDQTR